MSNQAYNNSVPVSKRINFTASMMMLALTVSKQSTCAKRGVGCILTKNWQIVATGYNGAPSGLDHCLDVGCLLNKDSACIACIHAEANAVMKCASADTAFCTHFPCVTCLRMLIQKGVREIIYWHANKDEDTDLFIRERIIRGAFKITLARTYDRLSTLLSEIDSELIQYVRDLKEDK